MSVRDQIAALLSGLRQTHLSEARKIEHALAALGAPPSDAGASHVASSAPGDDVLRFGRSRGTPLVDADASDLRWYEGAILKSLADPSKEKYRATNERDLAAVRAELARREGGPTSADDDRVTS